MTAADESAVKSTVPVHKVKVVSPLVSDAGAAASHDYEELQVRNQ